MLTIFKRMFGGGGRPDPSPDTLSHLAIDPARSTEFVTALAQADVWLLAIGQEGTETGEGLSHDELLDQVAQNRKELSEVGEDDSIVPFIFKRGPSAIMPFFSSVKFAEHFIQTKGPKLGVVYRPIRMRSGFLTSPELAKHQVVLNVNSRFERPLTGEERESLRKQVATT